MPATAEFRTLRNYLGGINVAGGRLKEIGLSHWIYPNTGADNRSGFTALPGGNRAWHGCFWNNIEDGTDIAVFWSSTLITPATAGEFGMMGNSPVALLIPDDTMVTPNFLQDGLSVRCIRN